MKCLSICQPFAELIVQGKKTIELRKWNTKFRGEFLVHAAKNILELIVVVGGWSYRDTFTETKFLNFDQKITNTHSIGNVMYTDYIHLFQISGIILLLSMIGAIVLTYRQRVGIKKQSYLKQISREREESVKLVDVEFNKGIKLDD